MVKNQLRSVPGARLLCNWLRVLTGSDSQSDEHRLIAQIKMDCAGPRRFVKFGFQARECNAGPLVRNGEGLLLDGDSQTALARKLLPYNIDSRQLFIILESIGSIGEWLDGRELDVLSVDVGGNDFWFAEAPLPLALALAVLEYNASLGLQPLTVPNDPKFVGSEKHESSWYHGASLTAMERLARRFGYRLAAVSEAGDNAFFLRGDLVSGGWPPLEPCECNSESLLRNRWAENRAADQWAGIAQLPFISISDSGHANQEQA